MKYVLIVAFLAVATAVPAEVPEPIRLAAPEEPQVVEYSPISTLPLFVPVEVMEAFQKDLENNPPIYEEIVPLPVIVVDSPVLDIEVTPVKVVDSPLQDFEVTPVKFVDSPLQDFEVTPVKFVDSPLQDFEVTPVKVVNAPEDVVEDIVPSAVNFVDVAQEQEVKVLVADLPELKAEEIEPSPLNIVNSPLEEAFVPSPEKIINDIGADRPFEFANPYLR